MTEPPTPPECASWPMDPACDDAAWAAFDPAVQARALLLASTTLEGLTGYRVGNCAITVRPVSRGGVTCCWGPFQPYAPSNWGGVWSNQACAPGADPCTIALAGPVGRVDEVRVDGDVLDPGDYRIDDGNQLVWQGSGDCPWPATQDMSLPDTELGTFSVTYLNAYPVDANGAYAVGLLALEFAKACAPGGSGASCALPKGVTDITRNGVSIRIAPGAFPDGNTGIRAVDAYIRAWNPKHLGRAAVVYSPDVARPRVVGARDLTAGTGTPWIVLDGGDTEDWENVE